VLNAAEEAVLMSPLLIMLQALTEIGAEHNCVIIVAMPPEANTTALAAAVARVVSEPNVVQTPPA
jgi:hypothetical protein